MSAIPLNMKGGHTNMAAFSNYAYLVHTRQFYFHARKLSKNAPGFGQSHDFKISNIRVLKYDNLCVEVRS